MTEPNTLDEQIALCKRGHERVKGSTCRQCSSESRRIFVDNEKFGGNREKAIQRDGEKCVKCGIGRQEHLKKHGRDITVDHIDGNGNSTPKHLKNNDLSNLQTLCISCHVSKDSKGRSSYMLTDEQVINIRHIGRAISDTGVAKLYGVHRNYVGFLMRSDNRKDLPNPFLKRFKRRITSLTPEDKRLTQLKSNEGE